MAKLLNLGVSEMNVSNVEKIVFDVWRENSPETSGVPSLMWNFMPAFNAHLLEKTKLILLSNICPDLVNYKRNVMPIAMQLMRPVVIGLVIGGCVDFVALIRGRVERPEWLLFLPLVTAFIVTLFSINKIVWSDLGVLIIQNGESRKEYYATNETIDGVCSRYLNKGCKVEELKSEGVGSPNR